MKNVLISRARTTLGLSTGRKTLTCLAAVLVSWGAMACSGEDDADSSQGSGGATNGSGGSGTGGGANTGGGSTVVPTDLVGTFAVTLVAPTPATDTAEASTGYTSLVGKVFDGPSPDAVIWEETANEGDCRLLEPRVPFCDPGCGTEVCVEDGQCQARPTALNLGTVHVQGMTTEAGETEFSMDPVANTYQPSASVRLPFPAFDEGASITVAVDGGDVGPFELEAKGIAPLELADEALPLTSGEPLTLNWTAGAVSEAHVLVKLDISHHGGSKGKIECDTADSGQLEISASLVSGLLDLGVAGFPTIIVTRRNVGTTGTVALSISSNVERAVEVDGLISCNADEQCPSGTCRADLSCEP